jgi:protocatechuate 3,4-dioxygenase beta subunit
MRGVTTARARLVVLALLAAGLALAAATMGAARITASQCDGFPRTPGQIGGIHFRPSPLRRSVVYPSLAGTRITLEGLVLTTACKAVPHARLDFWQADSHGHYDDTGFRLRSHQFTDANGRFLLRTIVPGPYPGRTPHVHVKVRAPGQPTLTTELYFPGASYNSRDPYFDRRLLLRISEAKKRLVARFDFVLAVR